MTRAASGVGAALLLFACRSNPEPAPPSPSASPSGRQPPLALSQRVPPRRPDGGGVATDGRELAKGTELHGGLQALCKADQKCLFAKCSERCFEFIRDAYKPADFRDVRHKNQVYFNCTGTCIDPAPPDAH
jgi:hypothetical protein